MISSHPDSVSTTPTEQARDIVDAVEEENAIYPLRHALRYLVAVEQIG